MAHGSAWGRRTAARTLVLLLCVLVLHGRAQAGGARFITGQGWGVPGGWNVLWRTSNLQYFTDPGPLSPRVSHAQADAMVAAAAGVWNLPVSSIQLSQGGVLAEDVDSTNSYFDGQQFVFPPDVQVMNEGNIPVAILYDADGSLVDMLVGQGASDPMFCRENAVVGDADDLHTSDGALHHATLVLNGRCVGSAPEQMTQMQYMLMRAFGRVLGLAWSQTNDNVFTGQQTVNANQMAFWPVMHPLDVICGNYTYQCMTEPFRLRQDDLNSLATVYPVYGGGGAKQDSFQNALLYWGILYFPTGQGMGWVNVATTRQNYGVTETWQVSSGVSGMSYEQARGTSIDPVPAANTGTRTNGLDGYFQVQRTPLNDMSNVFFTSESINPLYMGDAAIGPYVRPPVTPSGSPAQVVDWSALPNGDIQSYGFMTAQDAAANCDPGPDGTEAAPAAIAQSGWQSGQLCSGGHESWLATTIQAGHSWALEVTATDESGYATTGKAQPVLGLWSSTDPGGTTPSVASEPVPFNSMALGMTQMQMEAPAGDTTYRMAIADQFGAGRPDFTYNARLLYAAQVTPQTLGSGGGQVVVEGMGFRQGNRVLINGVPARVVSWTANRIVANAPSMAAAGAVAGLPLTVTVSDATTNGSTTIPGAIRYVPLPDLLQLHTAPGALETGVVATVPFAVRVLAADGTTPLANVAVTLAVTGDSAQLDACGTGVSRCVVTTGDDGVVGSVVRGMALGTAVLSATEDSGGATLAVTVVDTDPVRSVALPDAVHYVAAGASGSWTVALTALQDGVPLPAAPVMWSAAAGAAVPEPGTQTGTDGRATVQVTLAAVIGGSANTVQGCAWGAVCADWTAIGVSPALWRVGVAGGEVQRVPVGSALQAVHFQVTDGAGHALERAGVRVLQRVLAWEGECASGGRCAAAPVLAAGETSLVSDAEGAVSVTPLEVPGVPQVVEIAITTGDEGFATVTLVREPAALPAP